jgi:hypothetical protein
MKSMPAVIIVATPIGPAIILVQLLALLPIACPPLSILAQRLGRNREWHVVPKSAAWTNSIAAIQHRPLGIANGDNNRAIHGWPRGRIAPPGQRQPPPDAHVVIEFRPRHPHSSTKNRPKCR